MGGFCLPVEFLQGGPATNGANQSSFLTVSKTKHKTNEINIWVKPIFIQCFDTTHIGLR